MSCDSTFKRVGGAARRSGLARLASRSAAYLGMAAGLGGALAVAALARRYGRRLLGCPAPPDQSLDAGVRDVPTLPASVTVAPAGADEVAGPCVECRASPASKPGAWYVIDGLPHCQDCAPRAARRKGVALAAPAPARTPTPEAAPEPEDTFVPGKRVNVSLVEGRARVRVVTDDDPVGQWHFHERAYLVIGADGQETGLAITPTVTPLRDSQGDVVADERGRAVMRTSNYGWYLAHQESGVALAGPFKKMEAAQGLAEVLAQLDWKRKLSAFSPRESRHVRHTIADYEPNAGALAVSGYRQVDLGYRSSSRSPK